MLLSSFQLEHFRMEDFSFFEAHIHIVIFITKTPQSIPFEIKLTPSMPERKDDGKQNGVDGVGRGESKWLEWA